MRRSPRRRKKSVLSDSLNHQLNMYVVAAGAAGVGMLALAQSAEARVVYTPAFQELNYLSGPDFLYLDLNHDGVNDFQVNFFKAATSGFSALYLNFYPANLATSNAIRKGKTCFLSCPSALPGGIRVGGTNPSNFSKQASNMARINWSSSRGGQRHYGHQEPWAGTGYGIKGRYLGLRFSVGGQIHYGWARFNVSLQNLRLDQNIIATLTGYAYETVPDKPIITGDTGPSVNGNGAPQTSMTKPASPAVSLGLLALGAPGLEIWRREDET